VTSPGTQQRTASSPRRRTTIIGAVAGSGLGAALVLALLAGAGAFAATVVPRENAHAQSSALHNELAAGGPGTASLFGRSDLSSLAQGLHPADPDGLLSMDELAEPETALSTELTSLGVPLSARQTDYWHGLSTSEYRIGFPNETPAQTHLPAVTTALNYRTGLPDHAVLVQGALPDRATSPAGAQRPAFFQVAVTEQTASTFDLRVGDALTLASASATPTQLRVTGIIKVRDPADDFWGYDLTAVAPQLIVPPKDAPPYYQSDFFVGQGEVAALQQAFSGKARSLEYALPLDLSHLTSAQAQPLADALVTATADAVNLPLPGNAGTQGQPTELPVDLAGGPTQLLGQFLSQRQAVNAVLSMVVGSLAALGAAVLLLCILLLAERRSAEFALLRARGASGRQLALLAARASAISVLPAAAGLLLGGVAVPSPLPILAGWWVPALIALVGLAGPSVVAAIRYRAPAGKSSDRWSVAEVGVRTQRAGARRDRIRRAVGSAAAVVLCVGAVAVLRQYGSGSSLLAALAPFLIAVPIAIGIYYLTPLVVRALTHAAARRRDAVPFIAMARASRGSTIAWLPSLALVLTLAVVAVGSIVHDTVVSGEVDGSWTSVGADDVITAPPSSTGLSTTAVHTLSTLPGVARSATAAVLDPGFFALTPVAGNLPTGTAVVVVDAARYSALVAGTPAAQLPSGLAEPVRPHEPVPFIASADVAKDIAPGSSMVINQVQFPIKQVGITTGTAALPGADDFVILPSWALGRYGITAAPPSVLMLDGDVSAATLTATLHQVASGAIVTRRATQLAVLTHTPFQADTFNTLNLSMLAAAVLAVVALLSGLTMGARSREQALARLATMGLSRRQANRLVLLENLPALAAALLGGVVCTVAIGALIGPGIDLGVFTGTAQAVPLRVDLRTLTLAGAAIALTAAVTLAGHTVAAHRRGVTAALRLGNGE
jgi:putative ABC transport system permease protein